jgi:hypothetical protein
MCPGWEVRLIAFSLGPGSFNCAHDGGKLLVQLMYNNKTTLSGDALVAPFLSDTTTSVPAYGSWVVGMNVYNVWDSCGLFLWSLWETSRLILLGSFFMQSSNLSWSSGYTCLRSYFFLDLCQCMLCALVAFNEMITVPYG